MITIYYIDTTNSQNSTDKLEHPCIKVIIADIEIPRREIGVYDDDFAQSLLFHLKRS